MPDPVLFLPEERQRLIMARLSTGSRVLAPELAREFGTSEDTIRRDLRTLARAGFCQRVYGGALPLSPAGRPLREREGQARERKARLAEAAVRLVFPGQTLFIDTGSTNEAIARALPENKRLTVATNAPSIAVLLAGRPGFEVIVIGGPVDARTGASLGAKAIRDAETVRANLFFMGGCAVNDLQGIAVFDYEEAEFKRAVAHASASVAAAITNEKLGTTAPFQVLPAAGLDHLIVEHDAVSPSLNYFEEAGTIVHRAKGAEA